MTPGIRVWEIDFLRGTAIILMVIFHTVVDLKDFYHYTLEYMSGFWFFEGRTAATLFIFLAGVSTVFGRHWLRHALTILGWGLLITIGSYIIWPAAYIRFGILHLIGCCLLLGRWALSLSPWLLIPYAIMAILTGFYINSLPFYTFLTIPLGLYPAGFTSLDYYPLFPWSGVFLSGIAAGKTCYLPDRSSLLDQPPCPGFFNYLGRHSLFIYLAHQPLLLLLLYLVHQNY